MNLTVRLFVPVVAFAVLAGSAAELYVAVEFRSDPVYTNRKFCHSFLCDQRDLQGYAYDLELKANESALTAATPFLEESLSLDPASPRRWADLGELIAFRGDIKRARASYARAFELGKTQIGILLDTAYFHLRYGDRLFALQCLSRVLTLTSGMDDVLFSYLTPGRMKIEEILANGVPPDERTATSYLGYIMTKGKAPDAGKVWQWMETNHLTTQKAAIGYIDYLMHQGSFTEAVGVWFKHFGSFQPGYRTTNFLYNSDFEAKATGSAFDWLASPPKGGEARLDSKAHSGQSSLYLKFGGDENVDYGNIQQETVLPAGRYRLQAWVRSEKVTTDQGVFFHIASMDVPGLSAQTEATLGTTDWHTVSTSLVVPAGTHLFEVRVMRKHSDKFDNKIGGAVWIDQVSLTRE